MSKIGYKTESDRQETKALAYKMLWEKYHQLETENKQLRADIAKMATQIDEQNQENKRLKDLLQAALKDREVKK